MVEYVMRRPLDIVCVHLCVSVCVVYGGEGAWSEKDVWVLLLVTKIVRVVSVGTHNGLVGLSSMLNALIIEQVIQEFQFI